jgi:hypothetical protein
MPLQIRRGTQQERDDLVTSYVPLAAGEPLFSTDEGNLYIGDGTTPGGVHVNAPPNIAALLPTYQGQLGEIEKNPLLSPGVKSPFITFNGISVTIDLDRQISSNITPNFNEIFNLGENDFRFKGLYVGGGDINIDSGGLYIGEARIIADGTAVVLPSGTTIGGKEVLSADTLDGGVFSFSIGSDDSTILLNADTGEYFGAVVAVDDLVIVDPVSKEFRTDNLVIREDRIVSNSGDFNLGTPSAPVKINSYQESDSTFMELTGTLDPVSFAGPWINFVMSRGTLTSPVAVQAGDILSGLIIQGFDGASNPRSVTIGARVDPNETVSAGNIPGEFLAIVQSSVTGQNNPGDNQILSFNSKGVLSSPVMKVGVYNDAFARDAFVTAPEKGMIVFNDGTGKFQGFDGNAWVDLS